MQVKNEPQSGTASSLIELRKSVQEELLDDILPFWAEHCFRPDGRFAGVVANDLRVFPDVPQHVVLCARVLWTFAEAQALFPNERWLETARRALSLLNGPFWDNQNGGVFWSLDSENRVLSERKQVYAQAFAIYGLVAWYRATKDLAALERAKAIFGLLEKHSRDGEEGGYIEALNCSWGRLDDMRLSEKDLNSPKSYNTMLHVLEAYTALLGVWPDPRLQGSLKALLVELLDKIVYKDPFWHCGLFFDMNWRALLSKVSYGHDIEASWLFWEAAVAVGDHSLKERVKEISLRLADSVLAHGVDEDGAILYDGDANGPLNTQKHWWPQAEAVVGFLNAWQLGGKREHLEASLKAWSFIEARVIDHERGEWFAILDRACNVLPDYPANLDSHKIGPWKCPYHNGRACLEVIKRTGDCD